jgi:hypothetical protein
VKKVFSFHWRSVFVQFFFEFVDWVILTAHARWLHQSLCAGIVYEHYCLCPGWPWARRRFKKHEKMVYVHYGDIMCRECCGVKRNGHVCNKYLTLFHPPTISYVEHALCKIKISPLSPYAIWDHTATLWILIELHVHVQCIRSMASSFSTFLWFSGHVRRLRIQRPGFDTQLGSVFLFFLSCTIFYGLFIALCLHRNSTNHMHIIYDFLLHLLVQFTYIYREQPLVHPPPPHTSEPLTPQGLFLDIFAIRLHLKSQ